MREALTRRLHPCSDALATADLFLAITAGLGGDDRLPLRAILR